MPTERMEEVEVVCEYPLKDWQGLASCPRCAGKGVQFSRVPEGSLTAARLRLADAAEAREVAHRKRMARIEMGLDCSVDREYLEALAAEEDAEDQEVEAFEALAALRTARGEG